MPPPPPRNSLEIIPDRFYFVTQNERPADLPGRATFCVDDALVYRAFYMDFGPLNLSLLYRYCTFLHDLLLSDEHKGKQIVHYANSNLKKRSCAAVLVGAYCIIYRDMSPEEAYRPLSRLSPPLMPFRDASYGSCTYKLTVMDVLRGITQAKIHGWLDFTTFDCDEYEHYEQVPNGDLNWHVPGKLLAFAGPHNVKHITERGYPKLAPENFFEVFKRYGITDIVRTNKKMYDASKFTSQGFKVHELFFVDGTTPTNAILARFLEIVEGAKGGVAVHCKAGLGRTGTLIACFLMKHYMLTAAECIGWMRVCRPGSIIGPQQYYLGEKQTEMWRLGSRLGVVRQEMGTADHSFAGWANKASTVVDTKSKTVRSNASSRRQVAAASTHDEVTDYLGALNISGRASKLNSSKMDPTSTAPPGMSQGDGLNAAKQRRALPRGTSTGALRVGGSHPPMRRSGSEGLLRSKASEATPGRAPTKAPIGGTNVQSGGSSSPPPPATKVAIKRK